jgi:hypothetical protein
VQVRPKKRKIPPRQALAPLPVQKAEALNLIDLICSFSRSLPGIDHCSAGVATLLLDCKKIPKSLSAVSNLSTKTPTTFIDATKGKRLNSESGN